MSGSNGNLGRDKIWTPEIWAEIDKAVKEEVGQIRVAQKVFPSTPFNNGQSVPADLVDQKELKIDEGLTKPFVELSREFTLTQAQVDNESTLRTGRTLARLAARDIALAEDTIVLQGSVHAKSRVRVVNAQSAKGGLLDKADGSLPQIDMTKGYPESVFKAVADGLAHLVREGQPGPYALLLESRIYADTYAPLPGTLVTTADRIAPLVPGGFYSTGTLPTAPETGLLASLGGEPTTIYVGVDATTAFTQADTEGNYRFRVFERVQFVARDERALVKLEFK